jgi:CDP-diacylglycerol--glycerol-3-phosphate 3-phosphatidyltransferase
MLILKPHPNVSTVKNYMSKFQLQLRREVIRIGTQGAGFLFIVAGTLNFTDTFQTALSFLLLSMVSWFYVLQHCHRRLYLNYDELSEIPFSQLGTGNRITLFRGLLIAATAGFLGSNQSELSTLALFFPAISYTVAAISDALDGYIARITNQTTQLGKELDTELDAMGLLIAPALAVLWDKLHFSYLSVSIAYYIFRVGIYYRKQLSLPVFALPPDAFRRRLAGYQMGIVATSLWFPIPAELTRPIGILLRIPLLIRFALDWLHVSGRINDS